MTRFVRLFSYDPIDDPGARLRFEYDPAFDNAILADEDVLPEERDNPDARDVTTLHTMQLTTEEVRWLARASADLLAIMERQDVQRAAEIELPAPAEPPAVTVETDTLDGIDQSDPAPLAELTDMHSAPTLTGRDS